MGAETNELDTRAEDKARTEGQLAEFWEEEGACCPYCGCKVTYPYGDSEIKDKCSACGSIFYNYF